MNFTSCFIQRPVLTTLVMLALFFSGFFAYHKLAVNDIPSIEYPHLFIHTHYPGASPEIVLEQVTKPLEKELGALHGIKELSSESGQEHSQIRLTFSLTQNMDEARREVEHVLHRAKHFLPKEIKKPPSYHQKGEGDAAIMELFFTSDEAHQGILRPYAENYIIPRLQRIEGVANIILQGDTKSLWICINPHVLKAKEISPNQIIDTIRQHTKEVSLGAIQTSEKMFALELVQTNRQIRDLEKLKIGSTGMTLGDIAEIVERSKGEQAAHFACHDTSQPVVVLSVLKTKDANTIQISKDVKLAIQALKKELPPTFSLDVFFDKALWVDDAVSDVKWTLVLSFLLVSTVIYFSLGRFLEALIPSLALPLSILGTFGCMYLLHFSLNLLSLLALTLSVGFVVDDAIVVLENIFRHKEKGLDSFQASIVGAKEISFTVISITVSLLAVFIPLLFMPGINGLLFREFSMTLAIAITISAFISLSLIPMLCSRYNGFVKTSEESKKSYVLTLYGKSLKKCLRYPKILLFSAFGCLFIAVLLFRHLPVVLVPAEDRGFLFSFMSFGDSASPEHIKELMAKVEKRYKSSRFVESFLNVSLTNGMFQWIRLRPAHLRPPQEIVIESLHKSFQDMPEIQQGIRPVELFQLDFDFSNAGQYHYVVSGIDHDAVIQAAERLEHALRQASFISLVENSIHNDSPKLVIEVNQERADAYGVNKEEIQSVLSQLFAHARVGTLQRGAVQENIYIALQPEYEKNLKSLDTLFFTNSSGMLVPLKAIAGYKVEMGSSWIEQQNLLSAATLSFNFQEGIAIEDGLEKVEKIAARELLPGIHGSFSGSAKILQETTKENILLLISACFLMYIVLGILYESFIHPLTILSSLPFAGLGGIITLYLFQEPISLFSMVGFLLLLGIVKKNGIMMIDFAIEAKRRGVSSEEAIYEGSLTRFRPIMMTTIVAVMGALPLAIGIGESGQMLRGLGLVLVGGLVFSQALTLYITPLLYLSFENLQNKLTRKRAACAVQEM